MANPKPFVKPDDSRTLADTSCELRKDLVRTADREAGLEMVDEFSARKMVRDIEALYEDLLA